MIYEVYISENITDVDGHWCFPAPMTNFKHNASIVALCKFECQPLSLLFSQGLWMTQKSLFLCCDITVNRLIWYRVYSLQGGKKFPLSGTSSICHDKRKQSVARVCSSWFLCLNPSPNVWVRDCNFVMTVYIALGLARRQWEQAGNTSRTAL